MFTKKLFPLFVIIVSVVLLSCATTGPGGKQSFIIIPSDQEVSIGQGMAQQVEETEKLLADPVWQSYINEVGQKIVAVCDRKDITYQFKVIESDHINAFAAPGGFIYFYTGLLREMDNEAEMAAVMAHEISHVVGRHSVKRLQTMLGVATAYQLVFGEEGASEVLNVAINVGMSLLFADYSRDDEREADDYGIHYMVKAGYDPNGSIGMFEKLAALGGGGEYTVFERLASTHPETNERISNARAQIAGMRPMPAGLSLGTQRYQQMLQRLPAKASGNTGG